MNNHVLDSVHYKKKYDISVFISNTLIFSVIFIISFFFRVEKFILIAQLIILLIFVTPVLVYFGKERLFIFFISFTFIPFEFIFGGVEGWQIKDFLTPLFLIILFCNYAIKRKTLVRKPNFSIPLLLFISIALAHILTLQELQDIFKDLFSFKIPAGELRFYYDIFACGILYFLIPFFFRKESHIKLLIKMLGIVCLCLLTFSLIKVFLGVEMVLPFESSISKVMYVSAGGNIVPRVGIMGVAGYFLFVIAIVFVRDRSKCLFIALTSLSLFGILLSGGRAMLIGALFALSLFLFLTKKKFRAAIIPAVLIIALIIVGLYPGLVHKLPPIFHRPLTIFSSENPSLSRYENTRIEMWSISWNIISKNPFWGSRSFNKQYEYNEEALTLVRAGGAHNMYLSTAASFGIPALIIWIMIAFIFFRRIIYLYKKSVFGTILNKFCLLLAILLGVSFLTFFLEGGAGGGFKYFLYLGLIDSAWYMYNKRNYSRSF